MPFSKNLSKYPSQFLALADIPDDNLPHIFHFAEWKQAHSFRMKVYGFIEALRFNKHPLTPRMDALVFRVVGTNVVMELRDRSGELQALDEIEMLANSDSQTQTDNTFIQANNASPPAEDQRPGSAMEAQVYRDLFGKKDGGK